MLNNFFFVCSFSQLNLSKVKWRTLLSHCPWTRQVLDSNPGWRMPRQYKLLLPEAVQTLLLFPTSYLPWTFVLNQKRMFVPFHQNFCSFLNFCTFEPICFAYVHSISAVLLFPLCAALRVVRGLGPGNRCLQLYLECIFYYMTHLTRGLPTGPMDTTAIRASLLCTKALCLFFSWTASKLQSHATVIRWSNRSVAGSYIGSYEIKRLLDNKNICRQFFIADVVDNVD